MSNGKSIPVWYPEEERRRVEEAAALAGYKYLSKYIRDRSLGRGGARNDDRDSVAAWAERQELAGRLAEIERSQQGTQALLAMLLFLMRKKATAGDVNELMRACAQADVPADVLAAALPDLAGQLARFTEDV